MYNYTKIHRSCFIAEKDFYLIGADYDQQEFRIIADESGDPRLLEVFEMGGDPYVNLAKLVWPGREISKKLRYLAKQNALGIAYWMSAGRFVSQSKQYGVDITYSNAKEIIEIFSQSFAKVIERRTELYEQVLRTGTIRDRYGRQYRVPRKTAYKAFNNLVQGTAARVLKKGLLHLDKHIHTIPGVIVNTVHDEVICEVPVEVNESYAGARISFYLEDAVKEDFRLPIKASPKFYGISWGDPR
jgi:DNA polymerase-1